MISTNKNFIFIHIPKTGGNSVQNVLAKFSDDKIVIKNELQDGKERFELENRDLNIHKHSTLRDYKSQLSKTHYKTLFKFSIIRNPYERLVSYYFSPHRRVTEWNREDFKNVVLNEVKPMSHFVKTKTGRFDNFFAKNTKLDSELDFLIRFENLTNDFNLVCEKLKIPKENLPHRNKSNHLVYKEYYDKEILEIVNTKFKQEIEFGNYIF